MKIFLFIQRSFIAVGLFIFFSCAMNYNVCVAQAGEWTWMNGLNGYDGAAVIGTLGVPDVNNTPRDLYEPAEFKDLQGRFWLFGGSDGGVNEYNTLWMYDKTSNEWTWEGGSSSSNQHGFYGTKGIPSVNNHPGARAWGVPTWVDSNGVFWLFGGVGYDSQGYHGWLNDLWSYNIATSEWTWVSGSNLANQTGVYGSQGIPDTANHPGMRAETNASWIGADNTLWFFGGQDYQDHAWNDLWRYDPNTHEWTWMSGSNTYGQSDNYGTLGIPSPNNHPGQKFAYSKWRDAQNNFWMFGGWWDLFNHRYNDLWKYDPVTNEWTWMSGNNAVNEPGTYTAICDSSTVNFPRSRFENRACGTDKEGKFWFFGGTDDDSAYNDLWYYNPSTNEWTWASGSSGFNASAVYGVRGVPDVNNQAAAYFGSVGWIDDSCQFWMFGGMRIGGSKSNTLWKFIPGCGACNNQLSINLSVTDRTLCEKFCVNFTDQSINNPISWQWQFPGGTPSSSTDQNPTNICYDIPGSYDVTLITTNANGSDTLTLYNYITVYSTPPFPTITQVGYTLTSSPASSYQWQFNTVDIPGATNQSYAVLQSGDYTVIVGDSNSCKNSFTQYVLISGIDDASNDTNISIYPNPSSGNFTVELLNEEIFGEVSIDVVNTLGQKVFFNSEKVSFADWKKEINLSEVVPGVYFIEIKTRNVFLKKKIIIMN